MPEYFGVDTSTLPIDGHFLASPDSVTSDLISDAQLGAEALYAMFGFDRSKVLDILQKDYALLDRATLTDPRPDCSSLSVVGLNFADNSNDGITPGQLVAGYQRVAGSKGVKQLDLHKAMFVNRSAAWWNQRRPDRALSEMSGAMIFGAFIIDATAPPEGLKKLWVKQQRLLLESCVTTQTTATEGMTPGDALVADVMALLNPSERPRIDENTFVRFVQHDRDLRVGTVLFGPDAGVVDGRFGMFGEHTNAYDIVSGFRRVMGPRKSSQTV